jgi:hypothetical protein
MENQKQIVAQPIVRSGPLLPTSDKDMKDPCPVFVQDKWHIFGSFGSVSDEKWRILHAVAKSPEMNWQEETVELQGVAGHHVAAPGVIFDETDGSLNMFVQTEFMGLGGTIEYLKSQDLGQTFNRENSALLSLPSTDEAGIYDPHPAIIKGEKYLVYSGAAFMGLRGDKFIAEPNIFLARSKSNTWLGPWDRLGKILDHREIEWHHNQLGHPEYEWGIEGPQLVELPSGRILLNATSFLPGGEFSTRQRVFFAISDHIMGPYKSLGPVLDPMLDEWGKGENGHAAAIIKDGLLYLYYQARSSRRTEYHNWRYGLAIFTIKELEEAYLNPSKF